MPAITRAQGYPSFKQAGLIETKFDPMLDKNIYARLYLPRVTSSKYIGKIKNKGDKVMIARVPKIKTEPYVAGKPYTIETNLEPPFELQVNRGLRWKQYYDENDAMRTHVIGLNSETLNEAANTIGKDIEVEYFGEYPSFVPSCNTGNSAGFKSGGYTLGSLSNPVALDKNNVLDYVMQFLHVLNETDVTNESGVVSLLVPEIVAYYIRIAKNIREADKAGGKSSLKTRYLQALDGLGDVYVSNLLPKMDNGAYPIICNVKEAMNFVIANKKTRIISDMDLYDGTLLRGYAIYDWGVAREEGLALGYIKPVQPALSTTT